MLTTEDDAVAISLVAVTDVVVCSSMTTSATAAVFLLQGDGNNFCGMRPSHASKVPFLPLFPLLLGVDFLPFALFFLLLLENWVGVLAAAVGALVVEAGILALDDGDDGGTVLLMVLSWPSA